MDERRLPCSDCRSDRRILLVFNGLSQHLCALPVAPGRVPRQVFASQASCAACCSELLPPPGGRPLRACSGPSPSGSTVAAAHWYSRWFLAATGCVDRRSRYPARDRSSALRVGSSAGRPVHALADVPLGLLHPSGNRLSRSARTHAPALRACVQIAPDRPSIAGTPADKRFGNAASDTSKINFKGVHKTGSTPHRPCYSPHLGRPKRVWTDGAAFWGIERCCRMARPSRCGPIRRSGSKPFDLNPRLTE